MKRLNAIRCALLACMFALTGCIITPPASEVGWITLFDGTNLNNFNRVGDANWRLVDGLVQADLGGKETSHLVSKQSYGDFQIRAEFWVDEAANSGIFIRLSDPAKITATNAYEVNIYDARPDPAYGTGGIPGVAPTLVPIKAAGKWNLYEITAKGSQIIVTLNGIKTVDVRDSKFAKGPFSLQYGGGVVKFRKVQIRPI
jgi:hypothetical protein